MSDRGNQDVNIPVSGEESLPVGSIPRAAKILISLSKNINTVTEIASDCNFAKSTVHRVLKLLERSYIVTEDPAHNRYYLGPLLTRIASNPAVLHEYLVRCAIEEMKRLSEFTNETISLDILLGVQTIPLFEIPSNHDIRIVNNNRRKIGLMYAGASARVLLSQLSDERLTLALKYINIPRVTEKTVVDKKLLVSQILNIREKGYAASSGELIPGGTCISAPVKNYTSPAVINVIGPEYRIKPRLKEIVKEIKVSSKRISENIHEVFKEML